MFYVTNSARWDERCRQKNFVSHSEQNLGFLRRQLQRLQVSFFRGDVSHGHLRSCLVESWGEYREEQASSEEPKGASTLFGYVAPSHLHILSHKLELNNKTW